MNCEKGGIERYTLEERYGTIQSALEKIARAAGAIIINLLDFLCDPKCGTLDDQGEPIYADSYHLRPAYVRNQVKFLDKTVIE
ncbi:MAG: hypothetical protein LBQ51_05995 [Desulfovibrio sp.]|nr:hypothetical protein [Desulfovibrio sp.]